MPDRVFVAIELPEPARDLLDASLATFLHSSPTWAGEKPVATALFHVTLAFIGAVPDPAFPELLQRLRVAVGEVDPFDLCLEGVRPIPSTHHATMVWATLSGNIEAAGELSTRTARAAGLAVDPRPLRPHVTLIRSRRPRRIHAGAISAASAILSGPGKESDRVVSVRSVTVFSSTLGPGGPVYEPLAVLRLGAGPQGPGSIDIEHVFV